MPDNNPSHHMVDPAAEPSALARRYRLLLPVERELFAFAVETVVSRDLEDDRSWNRYCEATFELLALLRAGALTAEHVHARAIRRSRV